MWRAIVIFLAVYGGLVVSRKHRPVIAWVGILTALILGVLKPLEIITSVNWNVIGIFVGSLFIAELFIFSRIPETISDWLINRSPSLGFAYLSIIIFTSLLSAFIENVAAVLIVAPIALQLARKMKVSPIPVIVGLAISSNLQGTATLIGDPPSMILAAQMKMNFLDFFVYQGKPGIFFMVEIGAMAGFLVLYLFLRTIRQKPGYIPVTPVRTWVPVWLISIMIVLLSLASFIDKDFTWFGGTACILIGVVGLAWCRVIDRDAAGRLARSFDWRTTAFLAAIFVLVGMLERRGAIDALVGRLVDLGDMSPFLVYTIVVWLSVFISAFIDNVPYVTAMLPFVISFSERLGYPREVLAFGVLIGACLGGNITPIGASANIVAAGLLQKEGFPISFGTFVKIGFPFAVAATGAAYVALWLVK
jgi:Na+/H+ antiporter NhaD/arsenite permease-like protein